MIELTYKQQLHINARRKALEETQLLIDQLERHLLEADKDFGNVTYSFANAWSDLANIKQSLLEEEEEINWEDVA